ncbi:hypothetical protein ACIZ62_18350 [Acetobacterium carbinolicum]|uniref:hypothetical protein n=1 Tax=Acetobacterium carbinolicum TaxID=52690 RepID=UPI0039BFD360
MEAKNWIKNNSFIILLRCYLLETATNFTNSQVKLVFGTDLELHDYRVTGAREFGEMALPRLEP